MVTVTCNKEKEKAGPEMRSVILLTIVLVSFGSFTASTLGDVTNGTFDSDLAFWTTWYPGEPVSWDSASQAAVLGEDDLGGSSLVQTFPIDAGSASLYFDYLAGFEPYGEGSFSAQLLNLDNTPAIGSPYYFMYDWDWNGSDDVHTELFDPTYVTVTASPELSGARRVSLDLSWLGGAEQEVTLAFDFVYGLSDASYDGQITVDNVTLVPVPVPAAVVLALTGLGTALCQLRRRS